MIVIIDNYDSFVHVLADEFRSRGCRAPQPACQLGATAAELAAHTSLLLQDANFAGEAGRIAYDWARSHYDPRVVAERFRRVPIRWR